MCTIRICYKNHNLYWNSCRLCGAWCYRCNSVQRNLSTNWHFCRGCSGYQECCSSHTFHQRYTVKKKCKLSIFHLRSIDCICWQNLRHLARLSLLLFCLIRQINFDLYTFLIKSFYLFSWLCFKYFLRI